jgi:hypothetical protein
MLRKRQVVANVKVRLLRQIEVASVYTPEMMDALRELC